jgi:phospholipid/cholesterol/gamma-HCH transport system substrate-binding protein
VTGQASINFDFHPGTPVALLGTEPGMIELPTVPSDIDVLKANLTSLLQRISALPLDQIANQMLGTVGSANELVKNLNAQMGPLAGDLRNASQQATLTLKEAQSRLELREGEPMQNLNATLLDARKLVNDVDGKVDPLAGGLEKLMKSVLVTLDRAQLTLQSAQGSLSPDSALYFELNRTLRDVQSMADSIHAFADYMQRHPDALLTGKRQP